MNDEEYVEVLVRRMRRNRGANQKLGDMYSWSLPPIKTCPGATEVCKRVCYAKRMIARRPSIKRAWEENLRISKRKGFWKIIAEVLKRLEPGPLRLHVAGDFYDEQYTGAWFRAITANPHIEAHGYTRSWRFDWFIVRVIQHFGIWPQWLLCSTDVDAFNAPWRARCARLEMAQVWRTDKNLCDHQKRGVSCSECGRCMKGRGNVVFGRH